MPTFVSPTGLELTYRDQGDGPAVVVLGTLPGTHTWESAGITPAVRGAGFRTLILASVGDEDAADITALLDTIGADRCALMGYEAGALTMLQTAATEPRTRAVVLGGIGDRNIGDFDLATVAVPTIVLAGEDDHVAGDAHAVAHRLPQGEGKQIAGDEISALLDPSFGGEIVSFLSTHLH